MRDITDAKRFAQQMVEAHQERVTRAAKYEDMYAMRWDFKPEGDFMMAIPNPDPHVAVKGVVRLFISSKPSIKVTADAADQAFGERARAIAETLMLGADRRGPWMLSYELATSAILFGEAYVRVANVEDVIDHLLKTAKNDGMAKRYERLKRERPFLFRVYNPKTVFPEYSELGLESILVRKNRTARQIIAFWGPDALKGLPKSPESLDDLITTNELDSYEQFAVWLEGSDRFIQNRENDLGFIPWAGGIVEGTGLFDRIADQRLPLLYPVLMSGYWHAQSYADSVIYSLAVNLGKYPQIIANLRNPKQDLKAQIDWSTPLGVLKLNMDEKAEMFDKKVLDDSLMVAKNMADTKMSEMTIPKQVLGAAPDRVMAYSSLNLLVQAGRLPMIPSQRMVGVILAQLLELPFMWAKARDKVYEIPSPRQPLMIDPSEYENVRFEVDIQAQFAQDDAQRGTVASTMTQMQLWSRERAMRYTGVEDPIAETSKIKSDIESMTKFMAAAQADAQAAAQARMAMAKQNTPPQAHLPPEAVNYRPAEDFLKMCANCAFFRGPGVPCLVVDAPIMPNMTCNEWEATGEMNSVTGNMPNAMRGMMNPNTQQGGGGVPPITAGAPSFEGSTGMDRAGNPMAEPLGLPIE